jgi:hypothetical protein
MTMREGHQQVQLYRGQVPSPGRPSVAWREDLRGLIHAANLARDQGLAAVPAETAAGHLTLFRRGVTVGLSEIRRVPSGKRKQPRARTLLECLRHGESDVLRFLTDTAIPRPATRPNATCGPRKPSSSDGLRAAVPA